MVCDHLCDRRDRNLEIKALLQKRKNKKTRDVPKVFSTTADQTIIQRKGLLKMGTLGLPPLVVAFADDPQNDGALISYPQGASSSQGMEPWLEPGKW